MPSLNWIPAWHQAEVEIEEDNLIYSGFYQLKRYKLRHRCFSGEWSDWLTREQFRRADAASVLLWDRDKDTIVMVEQFRVGMVGYYPDQSPWILEIVAGLLEAGEDPKETVLREAIEEAKCPIKELISIGEFYNSPGGFAEKTYLYAGLVDSTGKEGIHGLAHEHEDIKVHVLPVQMVLDALDSGKLRSSASTVIALYWLKDKRKQTL